MNADRRMSIASRGDRFGVGRGLGTPATGRLSGGLRVHFRVSIDHLTGVISRAEPKVAT
jgi:hypothetical protein